MEYLSSAEGREMLKKLGAKKVQQLFPPAERSVLATLEPPRPPAVIVIPLRRQIGRFGLYLPNQNNMQCLQVTRLASRMGSTT